MTAKYGLPEDVRFCARCVMSNQRPSSTPEFRHGAASTKQTIAFDDDGVCSACRVVESKTRVDWEDRARELRALCDEHRRDDGRYDCIVPGSGGKDSITAAWLLRHEYGMHPLTVTWAPHLYTDWGRRNFDRWIGAGFANMLVTPNPVTHRRLTRLALDNVFHPFQPFILGQKIAPTRIATQFGVRLVFYGENEAEYGNPAGTALSAQRSPDFHQSDSDDLRLGGVPVHTLLASRIATRADLAPYLPLTREEAARVDVRYMGYYHRWHPQAEFYAAAERCGFEPAPERSAGSYSRYSSIDDKLDDLHYWTTFIKFGIGRATYDASQEIRSGDLTRDEGIALVRRYDGEFPERFLPDLCEYLSPPGTGLEPMTPERLLAMADAFRSPHLWDGAQLRHRVG